MTAAALPGTGIMGAAMARNLLKDGLRVTVWNRTRSRAEPLAAGHGRGAGAGTGLDFPP
ncbi:MULTISPECIES: NAD(P)-binding domain-containing protein [Thermomonosporaceae]|uniref:NAD(P)-binding domain-containing protein n=1 Tax=Thermomonosporaceae TaxID=2012 RepID=UPI002E374A9F|nr:NAD(P)-binding domain-containing protein [Spirillospora sp. NBC_01491]